MAVILDQRTTPMRERAKLDLMHLGNLTIQSTLDSRILSVPYSKMNFSVVDILARLVI